MVEFRVARGGRWARRWWMSQSGASVVSIHPYFKLHPGKLEAFRELFKEFVAKTSTEEACLYYDFSVLNEEVVFCREAYVGAEGLLAHLENVGGVIAKALEISELIRVEVHGAADELAKLKEPLQDLNPDYFVFECGVAA